MHLYIFMYIHISIHLHEYISFAPATLHAACGLVLGEASLSCRAFAIRPSERVAFRRVAGTGGQGVCRLVCAGIVAVVSDLVWYVLEGRFA